MSVKTLELSPVDRLVLTGRIMPQKGGSWDELIVAEDFKDAVSLSEDEAEAIELRQTEQGSIQFDVDKARGLGVKEFRLSEKEVDLVVKGFVQLRQREDGVPMDDPHIARIARMFIDEIREYENAQDQ